MNKAESSLKLGYFSRLRGRLKKAEPQACTIEKRVWDGSTVCTAGQGNPCHGHEQSQIPSRGQWEERLWCWRQALLRQGAPGLMEIIFLRSLCCCQFTPLSRQKSTSGVQLLLPAASTVAPEQPRRGGRNIPTGQGAGSLRTSGPVNFKILQKTGRLQEKLSYNHGMVWVGRNFGTQVL